MYLNVPLSNQNFGDAIWVGVDLIYEILSNVSP